ncbi:MAG: alpha/beta hydrolase [Christensenellaceae bacterium]|jgi:acetyl esterase/lipase|nr:alpha/beta hydrolase [Christensenellaceae bacterium]
MNRAEALFAAIDVITHPMQNYIKVKGLQHEFDIPYSNEFEERKMDLIYRKVDVTLPIIINAHGGGFVKGDKKHRHSICDMFADKNWFVINANYRLSPKYTFPALIEDMFSLMTNIPELAEKYNLDTSKIVWTGDSAGAYIAAMTVAALTNETLRNALELPDINMPPAGLIGFCGPYDLLKVISTPLAFGLTKSIAESFTGMKTDKKFTNLPEYKYMDYLSPSDFVTDKWCPTLLVYSEQDLFCKGLEQGLLANIRAHGVYVDESHSTKTLDNHCYHFNYPTKASKEALKKAFEFLDYIVKDQQTIN